MILGTIKYLGDKGYGFIEGDDGERYFFFAKSLDSFGPKFDELRREQRVRFTPIDGHKGPAGVDVKVIE